MTAPTTTSTKQGGLTPQQMASILALVEAQAKLRQNITDATVNAAVAILRQFPASGWWDDTQIKGVMTRILRIIQPAQRQAATLTDAYLTRAAQVITGRRFTPAGVVDVTKLRTAMTPQMAKDILDGKVKVPWVDLGNPETGPSKQIDAPAPMSMRVYPGSAGSKPLRKVPTLDPNMPYQDLAGRARQATWLDPIDPYERIGEQYRYQVVAGGVSEDKAAERALLKLAVTAETDVTMAVREQYHKTMGQQQADGYRRILHPELSKTGPCGLCVVAADRVYKVPDLLPLHHRCVCEVLPIYGPLDPGIHLNYSDLQALYEGGGAQRGKARISGLKKLRVGLNDSGTGLETADDTVRLTAQLDQLERSYETLALRAMRGENLAKSMNSTAARITEIRDQLGQEPSSVAPQVRGGGGSNPMKKMRVVLTENGEIGPVLVDGSQNYRGPADVAKTKVPDRKVRAEAQLAALEKSFRTLQDRAAHGENVDKPLKWQSDAIDKLRKELGVALT